MKKKIDPASIAFDIDGVIADTMGLFLDIALPRYQGKWSICNELIFTSFKVSATHTEYLNEYYIF